MSADSSPLLSPPQRKLVGLALGFLSLPVIAGSLVAAVAGAVWLAGFFSRVIWPLATAGILALVLRPVVSVFERRLHLRRFVAVILLYGLFLLAVAGLLYSVVPMIVGQALDLVAYLPTLRHTTAEWARAHFPDWLALIKRNIDNPVVQSVLTSLSEQAKELAGDILPSLKQAGAGIFGLFGLVTSLAVTPVYLFFFLLTDEDPTRGLADHLPFLSPGLREDVVFLVREFIGIVVTFFRGQLLIGLIMGTLYGIGFSLAGLHFGLVIGFAMGLLNVVPYLGSVLGLATALPLAVLQPEGSWTLAGLCLGVFAVVQATESWLLTPRIMGSRTGLHPVAIIVAVFFWAQAIGGILGMVLAVPLTAFFVTAWRLLRRKYFGASA